MREYIAEVSKKADCALFYFKDQQQIEKLMEAVNREAGKLMKSNIDIAKIYYLFDGNLVKLR